MASADDVLHGIIRRGMAWRVKYRVAGGKSRVPLSLLGVHPMNRRGVYPNADRVECSGLDVLKHGVSTDEADHEGVCAQEVPKGQQKNDPAVAGKPYVA